MRITIPKPVLFNCWKHHLGFLAQMIHKINKKEQLLWLKENLLKIGNSTTDLYTGNIEPAICAQIVIDELKNTGRISLHNYCTWIKESGEDYRTMEYPDGSIWVLRMGTEPGRHIHIHPGRGVKNTKRIKAIVLKTTVALTCYNRIKKKTEFSLEDLNFVRKELIGLPIIEKFPRDSELSRMISMFLNL